MFLHFFFVPQAYAHLSSALWPVQRSFMLESEIPFWPGMVFKMVSSVVKALLNAGFTSLFALQHAEVHLPVVLGPASGSHAHHLNSGK